MRFEGNNEMRALSLSEINRVLKNCENVITICEQMAGDYSSGDFKHEARAIIDEVRPTIHAFLKIKKNALLLLGNNCGNNCA
jgi:hypothetical protein